MSQNNNLFNYNAEQSVLGAMIENINCRSEALGALSTSDFYEQNKEHRFIFDAISHLVDSGRSVDITTITDELSNMKALESAGGVAYLAELQDLYISERHAMHHINIVRDLALVRRFLTTLNSISDEYKNSKIKSIPDYIAESEKKILEITKARRVGAFRKTSDVVDSVTSKLKMSKGRATNSYVTGVDTGFNQLNRLTLGFQPGALIILAARPSVGKTALAINLAYNVSSLSNKTVAFFSLEMSAEEIVERIISNKAQINSQALKLGNLSESDWLALSESVRAIKNTNILIDDTSGAKLNDIRTKCQKLKAQDDNLGLIVIDYLGLINTNAKLDNYQLAIGETTRSLKALARELQVPILCLCQLSRASEKRTDRTPMLTDLRDSGSIEQDADQVMFIYRPKYQNVGEMRKEAASNEDDSAPLARCEETQVVVAKNRSGKTGIVYLNFLMNISKFIETERPGTPEEN